MGSRWLMSSSKLFRDSRSLSLFACVISLWTFTAHLILYLLQALTWFLRGNL